MSQPDHDRTVPRALVVIGGPYKSGTSRLCASIEALGYQNPAFVTGPLEYGHGSQVSFYLTRECAVARSWNRRLVRAESRAEPAIQRQLAAYLVDMFQEVGPRLVLKDPYLKLTAVHWCQAARKIGVGHLRVLLTVREQGAILKSWNRSRFLSLERHRHGREFQGLLRPVNRVTLAHLRELGVELDEVAHGDRGSQPIAPLIRMSSATDTLRGVPAGELG